MNQLTHNQAIKKEKKPLSFFKKPLWLVKYTTFEYLPTLYFYLPLAPYWLWLAFKSKSFSYFTNVNQNIEYSGFFGESKIDILNQIAEEYLPKTLFFAQNTDNQLVIDKLSEKHISFPLIVKPNVGERGNNVALVKTEMELFAQIAQIKADFIIQEFIDFEVELGVLYYRMPEENYGQISSITMKEFMAVKGDGVSTILDLLNQEIRFQFQIERLQKTQPEILEKVLAKGEVLKLEPIGNHCRGTKFLNANHLINKQLNEVFDKIALPMQGFHYGRFDLKVKSIEDLYAGKNIKILELNGVSSDPAHVYDPRMKVWQAYYDMAKHFHIIYQISRQNKRKGIPFAPFSEIRKLFWQQFFPKKPANA
jgi:hypothetical protein